MRYNHFFAAALIAATMQPAEAQRLADPIKATTAQLDADKATALKILQQQAFCYTEDRIIYDYAATMIRMTLHLQEGWTSKTLQDGATEYKSPSGQKFTLRYSRFSSSASPTPTEGLVMSFREKGKEFKPDGPELLSTNTYSIPGGRVVISYPALKKCATGPAIS